MVANMGGLCYNCCIQIIQSLYVAEKYRKREIPLWRLYIWIIKYKYLKIGK